MYIIYTSITGTDFNANALTFKINNERKACSSSFIYTKRECVTVVGLNGLRDFFFPNYFEFSPIRRTARARVDTV